MAELPLSDHVGDLDAFERRHALIPTDAFYEWRREGKDKQPYLIRPDLTTNLVISTDKRVYLVEATSHDETACNAVIAWTYPFEEVSRQIAAIEAENEKRDETVVTGVPVDQLDFDYEIDGVAFRRSCTGKFMMWPRH